MTIRSIQVGQSGVSNITPSWIYIETNDTYQTITSPGYLNGISHEYVNSFKRNMMALVSTRTSAAVGVAPLLYLLQLQNNNGAWSLVSPGSSSNCVQQSYVTLSAANVLAAYATPQLLLPAPGAGLATMLLTAKVITQVSTVFANGGTAIVQYGATAAGAGTNALSATIPSAEITASASQIYSMSGYGVTTVTTGITNTGIYFSNQTAAFTGGAGSTVNFALQYVTFAATV